MPDIGDGATDRPPAPAGDFAYAPWSMFSALGDAFCACEMLVDDDGHAVDYRLLYVNELFEDVTGLHDPVGRTALELVADLEPVWIDTFAEAALGGETIRFSQGSVATDRWFEVIATPLATDRCFAIVFHDHTERRRAHQHRRRVDDQFRALADELPVIAWMHGPDGAITFVNQTYCDYFGVSRDEMLDDRWQALTHPDDRADYVEDFAAAIADRRLFVNRVRVRRADGEWRWFESWGRPRFETDGIYLGHIGASLDVTERIDLETQRTELIARERRARHDAEILEAHAVRLSACVTVDDIARTTLGHLESVFDLRITAVDILDGDLVRIVGGADVDVEHQHVRSDAALPGPRTIISGTEQLLAGRDVMAAEYPHLVEMFDRYGIDTLLTLPLQDRAGSTVGAVVVGTSPAAALESHDTVLLRELVSRSATALERALLYERLSEAHRREHAIAVRLQQALLPDRVASVDGVEIVTRYFAADDVMQVGGDWFDTFSWPVGRIGVIVGDVVGHDLQAAASMGRLRAASGALIPLGEPDPAAMLGALDCCARGPDGIDFVTAACVVLETSSGRLSFGAAGHPPPLLVEPDGTTHWLGSATAAPIGQLDVDHWPHDAIDISPGTVVLLYTDGLVERRTSTLPEGLERLRHRASRLGSGALGTAVDALVDDMLRDEPTSDDVIVVAVRWTGPG